MLWRWFENCHFNCRFKLSIWLEQLRWTVALSNWYDQRVDRVKTWLSKCQFILIFGPLPVKRPPRKNSPKFLLHQKFRLEISGRVSWAISELSRSFPPLSPFKTLLARSYQESAQLLSSKLVLKFLKMRPESLYYFFHVKFYGISGLLHSWNLRYFPFFEKIK